MMRLKLFAAAFLAIAALIAPLSAVAQVPPGFTLGSNGFYYAAGGSGPYAFNGAQMTLVNSVGNQLFQCSSNGTATVCPGNVGVLVGQASGNNWVYTNTGLNGITIYFDACGGGGGGAGGQTGGSTAGGGGGSGGTCEQGQPVHIPPSGTLTLFVGVAGLGGAAGVNGLAGQNTTTISGGFPSINLQGGFGGNFGAAGTGGTGNLGGGIGGSAIATSYTGPPRGPYYAPGSGSGGGGATAGAAVGGGSNVTVLGGTAGAGNGAGGGGGSSNVCQGGTGGVSGSPGIVPVSCFGGGGGGGGSGAAGANGAPGTVQGYGAW